MLLQIGVAAVVGHPGDHPDLWAASRRRLWPRGRRLTNDAVRRAGNRTSNISSAAAPKIIAFGADWCPACCAGQPKLDALEQMGVEVEQINIDQHPDLVAQSQHHEHPGLLGDPLRSRDRADAGHRRGRPADERSVREVAMAERRCANCPPTPVKPKLPPVSGLVLEDGKRLWHHALVTCNAVVEMMHVYTLLGAPGGDPSPLRQMASTSFGSGPSTARKTMRVHVPHSDSLPW